LPTAWSKKRGIIHHYDKTAKIYDSLYREEQELKILQIPRHMAVHDSDLILDAGCGTGFLFEHVHKQAGHLVGVDLSKGLLRIALAHIKQAGTRNVSLVRADVDHLPFKERVFDKVFALTLLQDFSDLDVTLKEITRTAKNESTLAVTGLKKVFTEERFKQALTEEGLEINIILTPEQVKDFIAICRRYTEAKIK
jgi:ubiquinone/menaquinone biosynthesis C-methylase UbiE